MDEKDLDNPRLARQHREERMRYEVLELLHRVSQGDLEQRVNCASFAHDMGAWREEIYRVIDFLDRIGFVRYCGAGPVVCMTERGTAYLASEAGRRKRISDLP